MWEQYLIETSRGTFEVFVKGSGTPLCITHNYSSFNASGDYFANVFIENHRVFLVNLRECGNSVKAQHSYQLGLLETVFDLEAIRVGLGFEKWAYAGHSTGGILGIIYGIYFSESLNFEVIVGAAARDYMTFSKNCIYNNEHPHFEKMQNLFKSIKNENISVEARNELKIERTKLSLFSPNKYEDYFSLNIAKDMSASRLNFLIEKFNYLMLLEN